MDPEGKAISGSFLAVDHLKLVLVLALFNCDAIKNERFILFKSSDIVCILTGPVVSYIHLQIQTYHTKSLSDIIYRRPSI